MSTQVREWLNSHTEEERAALAASAGTSVGYLYQLSGAHRKASVELAARLNKASKGMLTLEGLRPDLHELLTQSKRRGKAA
jgi:DNA-binding transcriptional regulator YdaS (Cro superfamily)